MNETMPGTRSSQRPRPFRTAPSLSSDATDANARLIAAAPTTAEMAMAFTRLVERYVRDDTGQPPVHESELAEAMDALRAHIAKATGEQA